VIHPHIQNVRTHHQQAAVLEEQRLNGDDCGHNQDATPRTEGDCRQDAAQQVPGRPAGNRKVDHLRGKDERCHDPQERRLPLIEVALGASGGKRNERNGANPADDRNWQVEKAVGNVQLCS